MKSLQDAFNDLIKAGKEGEGSRGGHIIGHTRSGKPIYQDANHAEHKGFVAHEHRDAAIVHKNAHKLAATEGEKEIHKRGYEEHAKAFSAAVPKEKSKLTFKDAGEKVKGALKSKGWATTSGNKVDHSTSPDGKHRLYFKPQGIHHSYQPEGRGHDLGNAHTMATDTKGLATMHPDDIHEALSKIVEARSSSIQRQAGGLKSVDTALDDLVKSGKSGEGSRGGKIIGEKFLYRNYAEI